MNSLPLDIIEEIGKYLCARNCYRDIYNIGRDAAVLYISSKTNMFTRSLSHYMFLHGVGITPKSLGGFDSYVQDIPKTIRELKQACKTARLPVTGTKKALTARLENRIKLRFRIVLDPVILNEIEHLRFKIVSSYVCRHTYGLKDIDIMRLIPIGNTCSYYRLDDVRRLSLERYHSLQGLLCYKNALHQARKTRAEWKASRINSQRDILIQELERVGCQDLLHTYACDDYIRNGKGKPSEIASELADMRFLKTHTLYDVMYEDIVREQASFFVKNKTAHEYVRKQALKEWLQQFESRKAALECSFLPQGVKHILARFPRYFFKAGDLDL